MSDAPGADSDDDRADLTYGEAIGELDKLLDELEGADVDVDRLAQQVQRGAALVSFCRERLEVVSEDVDGVVSNLLTNTQPRSAPSSQTGSGSDDN